MLRNYFKIAIAVLRRRKFFTFISLFGISLTLTILMVMTAFIDHLISAGYPDTNRDRSLYVTFIRLQNTNKKWTRTGPASFYFFDKYISKMKTPERLSLASNATSTNTYINNKRFVFGISYTNEDFWNVLQFKFTEGKPYSKQHIENAEKVAVISDDTKNSYFGAGVAALGKYIETDNVQYRVIGVVRSVPVTMQFAHADIYLPYTLSKVNIHEKTLMGNFTGILLAKSADDLPKIKKEYSDIAAKIPIPTDSDELDELSTHADSYLTNFTRGIFGGRGDNTGTAMFLLATSIFVFIFMLLPTLNLININISRIMERSSEIGVRKAFGASSRTLVFQFIVENLILTFVGGAIGIVLSYIILYTINSSALIANMHLAFNLNVLLYSVVACLFFGFLSGVYPAWRMSRMHVVTALKA